MGAHPVTGLFVILHRAPDRQVEASYSLFPCRDRDAMVRLAADLQHDANTLYGRPDDIYQPMRLAPLDEEN